jgi:excisionase family DNA binding protein
MTARTLKLVEVSRYLAIPKRTLYNMLKDGRFPVAPVAGTKPRRWLVSDIDAWLAQR